MSAIKNIKFSHFGDSSHFTTIYDCELSDSFTDRISSTGWTIERFAISATTISGKSYYSWLISFVDSAYYPLKDPISPFRHQYGSLTKRFESLEECGYHIITVLNQIINSKSNYKHLEQKR